MFKVASLTVFSLCCLATPCQSELLDASTVVNRLAIGQGTDAQRNRSLASQPLVTLQFATCGTAADSMVDSIDAAALPATAKVDALRAFAGAADIDREARAGSRFLVRYEQDFTVEGNPVGPARVLRAELQLDGRRGFAVHRFRPVSGVVNFWFANGESAVPPQLGKPIAQGTVSSPFGRRDDTVYGPIKRVGGSADRPRGATSRVVRAHPLLRATYSFHSGVDFGAPAGTPVIAAGNGTVRHAAHDPGLGNAVTIDHDLELATRYGHLANFAPGIVPGVRVTRGEVIGFVGSTGLSSGPHLHYELLVHGGPVNPVGHRTMLPAQLRGQDLERFRVQVRRNLSETNEWCDRAGPPLGHL